MMLYFKRVHTLFFLLFLPFNSNALEFLDLNEMESISAKSGVTILFDGKTTITSEFIGMAWGDTDGIGGSTSQGWFVINGDGEVITTTTTISVKDCEMKFDTATVTDPFGLNLYGDSDAEIETGTTYVKMGLPASIDIKTMGPSQYNLSLVSSRDSEANSNLGTLKISNMRMEILSNPDSLYLFPKD